MDLGAYAQIDNLQKIMKANGIEVPRLRGLRLMKNEKPMTKEEIEECARTTGLYFCKSACREDFVMNAMISEYSDRTYKAVRKYFIRDKDGDIVDINWKAVHGKKRKLFKYRLKTTRRQVYRTFETFNKYTGKEGILYIHARIGGRNWNAYHGSELEKQLWFIEKVDDYFDTTYCDIYARIN